MKYSDIRSSIRSGDLLAFSHGSWASWSGIKTNLVRIFTKSTYSHVGMAWVVGGRVFVLEAVKPLTRLYPLSQSGEFYLLPLNAPWGKETEEFALACIGTVYDDMAAILAFLNRLEPHNVRQCSAYVIETLYRDDIDLGPRATPDAVVLKAQERGAILTYVTKTKYRDDFDLGPKSLPDIVV